MKPRQVPIFLYWRVENVQFWINSIGHLGWLSCILNFPRFHKNVNSLELWRYISENSSPKGSFWRNKRKSEFSSLSADSRYLLAVALKLSGWNEYLCFESNNSRTLSRGFNFHMAFLVVEILNERQLIKYAKISDKGPLLEGVPLTWTENDILT